jgi:hypothetical protein
MKYRRRFRFIAIPIKYRFHPLHIMAQAGSKPYREVPAHLLWAGTSGEGILTCVRTAATSYG